MEAIRNLYSYKDLLFSFVNAELKSRHRDKLLGLVWTVLDPLMMMLVYLFIVMVVFNHRSPDFPIYLYTGLIAWRFFAASTQTSSVALVQGRGLLTQVYFPRQLIPLSRVLAGAYDFLFAALVLVFLYLGLGFSVSWPIVLLPVILLLQMIMVTGLALAFSAVGISFRDLPNILAFVMRLGWYLSPGLYYVKQIPEEFRDLYMLNPMAVYFTLYRDVTLYKRWPEGGDLIYVTLFSVACLWLGVRVFSKRQRSFMKYL